MNTENVVPRGNSNVSIDPRNDASKNEIQYLTNTEEGSLTTPISRTGKRMRRRSDDAKKVMSEPNEPSPKTANAKSTSVAVVFYQSEGNQWLQGRLVHSKKIKISKRERLIKYTWPTDGLDYIEPIPEYYVIAKTSLLVFVKDGLDTIGYWYKADLIDKKQQLYQYTYADGQKWEQNFSSSEILEPERKDKLAIVGKQPSMNITTSKAQKNGPFNARPKSAKDSDKSVAHDKIDLIKEGFLIPVVKGEAFNLLNELTRTYFTIDYIRKYEIEEAYTIKNESQKNFRKDRKIRYVFHGPKNLVPIVKHGFDCTKAKTCRFGDGLYFSDNPKTCIQYSSSSYIIVAQIAEPLADEEGTSKSKDPSECAYNNVHWICQDSYCCIPKYLIKLKKTSAFS